MIMYMVVDAEGGIRMCTDQLPLTESEALEFIRKYEEFDRVHHPEWVPYRLVEVEGGK